MSDSKYHKMMQLAAQKWLHEEVVKSYDECEADATTCVVAELVMARIRSRYHQRTKGQQT
jgi:antitoxin ParD1/3/4